MKARELGCFEETQAFLNDRFPFNAVIVLGLKNFPTIETLKVALRHLQKRHPLLKTGFIEEKGKYYYKKESLSENKITTLKRNDELDWKEVVETELNKKFEINDDLLRITCLIPPEMDEEGEIILTFQHSIIDATCVNNFLNEFLSLCDTQKQVDYINKMGTLELMPTAERLFPQEFQGFLKRFNLLKFITRQFWDEVNYRIKSIGEPEASIQQSGTNKILTKKISKDLTKKLLKVSRKKRLTINHLFNAAILIAVHKQRYKGKRTLLRNFNFADLRSYLDPPLNEEHFGSYFSMIRFTLNMKGYKNIWDLAQRINAVSSASNKKGDKFSSFLLGKKMIKAILRFKSFRMGHTALSYTGIVRLKEKYGEIEVTKLHAFVSNFVLGPEYAAQVRLFKDEFFWDIIYLDSDMNKEESEEIIDEVIYLLKSAIL